MKQKAEIVTAIVDSEKKVEEKEKEEKELEEQKEKERKVCMNKCLKEIKSWRPTLKPAHIPSYATCLKLYSLVVPIILSWILCLCKTT